MAKYFVIGVRAVGQKNGYPQDLVHCFAWDVLNSEPSMWFTERGVGDRIFSRGRGLYEVEVVASGRSMIPVSAHFCGLPGIEELAGEGESSVMRMARKAQ